MKKQILIHLLVYYRKIVLQLIMNSTKQIYHRYHTAKTHTFFVFSLTSQQFGTPFLFCDFLFPNLFSFLLGFLAYNFSGCSAFSPADLVRLSGPLPFISVNGSSRLHSPKSQIASALLLVKIHTKCTTPSAFSWNSFCSLGADYRIYLQLSEPKTL